MAKFGGTLGKNKVLFSEATGALYNMILNQEVESRTIGSGMASLVEENTRDVGLYGDRILKYFTDILTVYDYEADSTDQLNVLKTYRPKAPVCEQIVIDTAKFIPVTLDNYLTKQGFSDETTFGQFNSVMESWLKNTKKVYLAKEYNAFLGTVQTLKGNQYSADLIFGEATDEAGKRMEAQNLAKKIADTVVAMTNDASRDYNDLGIEACYNIEDLILLMPSEIWNQITIQDIPTIYHDDRVMEVLKKNVRLLPQKYFGDLVVEGTQNVTASGNDYRFLHQTVVNGKVYMAGDFIPGQTKITDSAGQLLIPAYGGPGPLAKIYHKDAMPVLAGFETQTEFWNPSNLSRNDYLHFLYNSFDRFTGYPLVTIDKA